MSLKIFQWCDELIVANDHVEAADLLRDRFTRDHIARFGPIRVAKGPVILVADDGAKRKCSPHEAASLFSQPQIIPESP